MTAKQHFNSTLQAYKMMPETNMEEVTLKQNAARINATTVKYS